MLIRRHLITAGALSALLLAGCGSSDTSSSAATAASSSSSTSTSDTSSGSSSSSSSGTSSVASVALKAEELPASTGGLAQTSDGLLNKTPNTVQRVFADATKTNLVELDLLADTTPAQAVKDYPTLAAAAKKQVATATAESQPPIGDTANEYVGTNSSGKSTVAISFQKGVYICVVIGLATTGTTDPAQIEAIAKAQADKLT